MECKHWPRWQTHLRKRQIAPFTMRARQEAHEPRTAFIVMQRKNRPQARRKPSCSQGSLMVVGFVKKGIVTDEAVACKEIFHKAHLDGARAQLQHVGQQRVACVLPGSWRAGRCGGSDGLSTGGVVWMTVSSASASPVCPGIERRLNGPSFADTPAGMMIKEDAHTQRTIFGTLCLYTAIRSN